MDKKLHIKTFGCQMNVYDSQRIKDVLAPLGYDLTNTPEKADLVILNTCHIREKAAVKLYSELGRFKNYKVERKKNGHHTLIAVAGCVAQAQGEEILRRAPFVDIVLGPQTYHRLPEMITQVTYAIDKCQKSSGIVDIDFPVEPKFDHLPEVKAHGVTAFLSVQEGCDKFCTFCVVPYTRGAEYSRPVDDILSEARRLVSGGVREITLLGQNVNAYRGVQELGSSREIGLGQLLRQLAEIKNLDLLRYTTSHPIDMSEDLITAHGELDKLMPFLHLPVQSGSNRVLARMNRRHRRDDYIRIVDMLLAAKPDLKLSSDFIVGFPGETQKDFEATLALISEVGFIQAFSFKYSPRPGTPGALMDNKVPEHVKTERLAELQDLLTCNQRRFNESCIGKIMPVLLDRLGRKEEQLAGRSPYMQAVHMTGSSQYLGKLISLKIDTASTHSLGAVLADGQSGLIRSEEPERVST